VRGGSLVVYDVDTQTRVGPSRFSEDRNEAVESSSESFGKWTERLRDSLLDALVVHNRAEAYKIYGRKRWGKVGREQCLRVKTFEVSFGEINSW